MVGNSPNKFLTNYSGLSILRSETLGSGSKSGSWNEWIMSLTVFFALCILGIDFMIYFFFKLVYGEKHGVRSRRLPPGYYDDLSYGRSKGKSSPLYLVPARKNQSTDAKRILSMPAPNWKSTSDVERKRRVDDGPSGAQSTELLAYRRIASTFAHAKAR